MGLDRLDARTVVRPSSNTPNEVSIALGDEDRTKRRRLPRQGYARSGNESRAFDEITGVI